MRTPEEIKARRRERRRSAAAEYAREHRAARREARAPDARAVGAALLSLALDEAVARGADLAVERLLDRLAEAGYDRSESALVLRGMRDRHADAVAAERDAA